MKNTVTPGTLLLTPSDLAENCLARMSSHTAEDLFLPINSEEDFDFMLVFVTIARELHIVSSPCMLQAFCQMCFMTALMD
jgi:hypothetical protein